MTRAGSATFLLVGLLLLVTAAGLFIALVPVVRCRRCPAPFSMFVDEPVVFVGEVPSTPIRGVSGCASCGAGLKITLVAKWLGRNWWEGGTIGGRSSKGFRKNNSTTMLDRAGLPIGGKVTRGSLEDAKAALLQSGEFRSVEIEVFHLRESAGKVLVAIEVVEK